MFWPLKHLVEEFLRAKNARNGKIDFAEKFRKKVMREALVRAERHEWYGGPPVVSLSGVSLPVSARERLRTDSPLLLDFSAPSRYRFSTLTTRQTYNVF